MGLYDFVVFKYPVPGKKPKRDYYQTYDLGRGMMQYVVNANGELLRDDIKEDFTGKIEIYNTNADEWTEYRVDFINGVVVFIERLPDPFGK